MTFRHRAGVRPYTSSRIELAESCVFVKQSIPPSFCPPIQLTVAKTAHLQRGSFIPKLQEYFAEFLNWSSLTRLRMLSSPTCVGFRYESMCYSLRRFSCTQRPRSLQGKLLPTHSALEDNCLPDLPRRHLYSIRPLQPMRGRSSLSQSRLS